MKNFVRASAIGTMLVGALALSGCSAHDGQHEQSFDFRGPRLDVVNSNANMPVTASEAAGVEDVVVTVQTQTMVKSANTPAWSLDGTNLNLGTPCGEGVLGYCEGSYSITVPEGTAVYVNGTPATMR